MNIPVDWSAVRPAYKYKLAGWIVLMDGIPCEAADKLFETLQDAVSFAATLPAKRRPTVKALRK